MTDTTTRLRVLIHTELGANRIADDADFASTMLLDTVAYDQLDAMVIIGAAEDEFGIDLPDAVAERFWLEPVPLSELVALIDTEHAAQLARAGKGAA